MNELIDELNAIFPESITREDLLLVNANPLNKTIYYKLEIENYNGIYEPDFTKEKNSSDEYLFYLRRSILDKDGEKIC